MPQLIGFEMTVLDCVIGRRRITIQPSPSGLAKTVISKPIGRKGLDWVIGRRRITIQPSPSGLAKTVISKPIGCGIENTNVQPI